MTQLTSNIFRHEMLCKCGECKFDIADYELITVVQDAIDFFVHRDRAAKGMVMIKSGNRCPRYNHEIGGAINSYHQFGKAMDFVIKTKDYSSKWTTVTTGDLSAYLDGKYPHKYGIIGYWSGRVHFDVRIVKYRAQK